MFDSLIIEVDMDITEVVVQKKSTTDSAEGNKRQERRVVCLIWHSQRIALKWGNMTILQGTPVMKNRQ